MRAWRGYWWWPWVDRSCDLRTLFHVLRSCPLERVPGWNSMLPNRGILRISHENASFPSALQWTMLVTTDLPLFYLCVLKAELFLVLSIIYFYCKECWDFTNGTLFKILFIIISDFRLWRLIWTGRTWRKGGSREFRLLSCNIQM